jgi:hypothetical protein
MNYSCYDLFLHMEGRMVASYFVYLWNHAEKSCPMLYPSKKNSSYCWHKRRMVDELEMASG